MWIRQISQFQCIPDMSLKTSITGNLVTFVMMGSFPTIITKIYYGRPSLVIQLGLPGVLEINIT